MPADQSKTQRGVEAPMRSLEPRFLAPPFCRSFNVASTYPVGLSAVKDEQHGLVTGWNSINSMRVPSGS